MQNKLLEYKSIIEDLEDAEALETIRSDLMTYLQQANSEMTSLLEEKVNSENGTFLPECSMEELDVINKIKQVPFCKIIGSKPKVLILGTELLAWNSSPDVGQ